MNSKAPLRGSYWTRGWYNGLPENRIDLAPGSLRRVVVCEPSAEATSRLRYWVLVGNLSSSTPMASQQIAHACIWPDMKEMRVAMAAHRDRASVHAGRRLKRPKREPGETRT